MTGKQGRYGAAYKKDIEAQTLYQKLLGKEHPDTLVSMNNLACVLRSQGKYAEAEEIYRQVLKLKEEVLGEEHPDTLTIMNNLASVLVRQAKYVEAEDIHWLFHTLSTARITKPMFYATFLVDAQEVKFLERTV